MHAFPAAAQLQFLIGREVGQIALDPHSAQFRWLEGGQITVMGDLEHEEPDGTSWRYNCTAHSGPPLLLHRLIQKKVIDLRVEPLSLTLIFDDGATLKLHAEIGPWECGVIQFTNDPADGYIVY